MKLLNVELLLHLGAVTTLLDVKFWIRVFQNWSHILFFSWMKWWKGEDSGDTEKRMPVLLLPPAQVTGQLCGGCKDRLLRHPPCFPDQFVQPTMSFYDCRNNKGSADTTLQWWEVRTQKVLWTTVADQGSPPHKPASSYCPQALSMWIGLLYSRGKDMEGSESLLCFTCQLCPRIFQRDWAAPFTILLLADCGWIICEFKLLYLFSRNWNFHILPRTKDQNSSTLFFQWIELSLAEGGKTYQLQWMVSKDRCSFYLKRSF